MTFNEINNQMNYHNDIFGWTNGGVHFGQYPEPEKAMYQSSHYQMVASAKAVRIGHGINPGFRIGNMIAMVPIYPLNCKPANMILANEKMREKWFSVTCNAEGIIRPMLKNFWKEKGMTWI